MNIKVTTSLGKILAPILCISIPLIFIRDLLTILNKRPRLFDSSSDVVNAMFETDKLRLDLVTVALVLAFVGVFGRLYQPNLEWRPGKAELLKALGIALITIAITSFCSIVVDGFDHSADGFPVMIPGAVHLPILSVLCFGVMEAFRYRVKEIQLLGIVLVAYLIVLLFGQITVSPILPFVDLGVQHQQFPLISIDTYWRDWRGYLPFAHVLIGVLVYYRLGVTALFTFLFSAALFVMIASSFGVRPKMATVGYWFATVITLILAERLLRVAGSSERPPENSSKPL